MWTLIFPDKLLYVFFLTFKNEKINEQNELFFLDKKFIYIFLNLKYNFFERLIK